MKFINVEENDDFIFKTHFFGSVAVSKTLSEYTFPYEAFFLGQIDLKKYNIKNLNEGFLYIFLDLSGYYSEEYGEYSLLPIIYYDKGNISEILDDFNEHHDLDYTDNFYLVDDGDGLLIENDKLVISDKEILKFFMNFDNDIKYVEIGINEVCENKFKDGEFKIFK